MIIKLDNSWVDSPRLNVYKDKSGVAIETMDKEENHTVVHLTRKQVIELIAMLLVNTCPAPSYEEIDEALVKLTFNSLGQD